MSGARSSWTTGATRSIVPRMDPLRYRPLTIRLELDPLLCARLTACGLSARSLSVLGRPLRVTPCKGGVIFDGVIHLTSASLVTELLYRADLCDEVAVACGGEGTATGRWRMDRALFFRSAAATVHLYRGRLWPSEQDD